MVLVPALPPLGEYVATLELEVELIEKLEAAAEPFKVQSKVKSSELASEPLAVRLIDPVVPTVEPVAAGDCELQVGGVFLTTVQV